MPKKFIQTITLSFVILVLLAIPFNQYSFCMNDDETEQQRINSRLTKIESRLTKIENDDETEQRINSRLIKIENALCDPFLHYSDTEVAFTRRLTSHLSSYFGAFHVLSSDKIGHKRPAYVGLEIAKGVVSGVASVVPFGPIVSEAFNALVTVGQAVKEHYDNQKTMGQYYRFYSFAAIDRFSYLVSGTIAGVYSDQIRQLTNKSAVTLADSAGRTLKWYIDQHAGKDITQNHLILALGKYYVIPEEKEGITGKIKIIFSHHDSVCSPMSYCQELSVTSGTPLYDREIFLGSGLHVVATATQPEKKYIIHKPNNASGTHRLQHSGVTPLYTGVIGENKYGYRHVNEEYYTVLEKYLSGFGELVDPSTLDEFCEGLSTSDAFCAGISMLSSMLSTSETSETFHAEPAVKREVPRDLADDKEIQLSDPK